MCVERVDYFVIVNDDIVGPIKSVRGLHQRNPLSSYVFIICVEGFSALIRQAKSRGDIHGVKICRTVPIISHLLFAYNCFLFFRATENEAIWWRIIYQLPKVRDFLQLQCTSQCKGLNCKHHWGTSNFGYRQILGPPFHDWTCKKCLFLVLSKKKCGRRSILGVTNVSHKKVERYLLNLGLDTFLFLQIWFFFILVHVICFCLIFNLINFNIF